MYPPNKPPLIISFTPNHNKTVVVLSINIKTCQRHLIFNIKTPKCLHKSLHHLETGHPKHRKVHAASTQDSQPEVKRSFRIANKTHFCCWLLIIFLSRKTIAPSLTIQHSFGKSQRVTTTNTRTKRETIRLDYIRHTTTTTKPAKSFAHNFSH